MDNSDRKKEAAKICLALGNHIRELRIEKGMSVAEIAFKAGIDSQNLRKYELGKQEMKISMLVRISEAFEVSVNDIFNDETIKY